ncbi:hypothetical protein [Vibrio europaeus]|uniref:Uncharacterized protein n=1 Tax=Vibrio europaeus TaxID=300876 RepID=A0A178J3Y7_9VIBR|nr:hypothetical protein [Vibrio europaeus]MDC5706531.1 hypothetical protein [Vibrio europaeus]MDC5711936.1 hypothetical protein [Vibrio europaeus]MDC5716371.1 hypothetical protein [Vibrio europaeus]MDC5725942.1 hypothetical protein [Vibrio europaeus]MDC5732931.1 hypothetical protein [Vibrio europaeus]
MTQYCDDVRRQIQLFIFIIAYGRLTCVEVTVVVPLSLTTQPHSFLKMSVMVNRTQGMGDELDLK